MAFSEIKGTFANPNNVVCKDCTYRDKTTVTIGDSIKYVGVTRCTCKKFTGVPNGNNKSIDILFRGASCSEYAKE